MECFFMKKLLVAGLFVLLSLPMFASADTSINVMDLINNHHNNMCHHFRHPHECERNGCSWNHHRGVCEERRLECHHIRNPHECDRTPYCRWSHHRHTCERR